MSSVFNKTRSFVTEEDRRELLRDLRGGEDVLKAKKEKYLPAFPKEDKDVYDMRVRNSYLYNVVELNIQKLSSKPFSRPATIDTDDIILSTLANNFDNQDHTITEFARNLFEDALWYSQAHVFIDMPFGARRVDGSVIRDPNARPNATIIDVDNILDARMSFDNTELVYLRFREYKTIYKNYEESQVQMVKLFYKDAGVVYYNMFLQTDDGEVQQFEVDQVYALSYIPLVTLYPMSTRIPFKPTLIFQNMAYIQRAHFKTLSDKRNLEQILMCPILFGWGFSVDQITISTYQAIIAKNELGEASGLQWVETNGQGLSVAEKSLDTMREQMESIGVDLQTRAGGNQTATANSIDQANNNSILSCMAVALKESLEKIVFIYKDWFALNSVVTGDFKIDVVTKFDIKVSTDEMNYLNNALTLNIIGKEDYFNEGKRRGIIDSDLTFAEAQERLNSDLDFLASDVINE